MNLLNVLVGSWEIRTEVVLDLFLKFCGLASH